MSDHIGDHNKLDILMLRCALLALSVLLAGPCPAGRPPEIRSVGIASVQAPARISGVAPILLSGVPTSWDRLRGAALSSDICASIRAQTTGTGSDQGFDPAAIVSQALGQDFCAES
ncbi:hypothetical protein E4Z66_15650 [Aliishimia ponticola]|uniref:Uncharacterized protein n=1 Tax=Aliishimia ponticola TaxID=2499833 RepID=A0A4S4N9H3_9RHOB|nr:hypothetical protein [Aliishimia ponticola]THH35255.1 hypothetical protein E4Z66_15650 [Aliishimia ponticola]